MEKTSLTYKVAVVGPTDLVSGFKALGVSVFNAQNGSEALEYLKDIKSKTQNEEEQGDKYAVVFVIDKILKDIPDEDYKELSEGALPSVIAIPGLNADKEAGVKKLRQLTEKAIGSDILSM